MQLKTQSIRVMNAPDIPGLAFRGFRGPVDYPVIAEIITTANQADKIDHIVSADDIERSYQHLENCDPAKDMLFVEIDGQPIGYGRCWWADELNGDHIYYPVFKISPAGRLPGLGEAVLAALMRHLRQIAAGHPVDAPKYFEASATSHLKWRIGLLESQNFEVVRCFIKMVRPCSLPIEETPLPEGLEVHPAAPEHTRQIWEASMEASRDHWGFQEPTEESYQNWFNDPHRDETLWKVAWDGDEVAGKVLNFINHDENKQFNRKRGYTEDIGVRRPWRRQGVARALLTQSIQMFQEMGMDETSLGVDTENPNGALQLYKSVGYTEYKRNLVYRKAIQQDQSKFLDKTNLHKEIK